MTSEGFDADCAEALRALGKAMTQLSLYEPGHPAVTERLEEAAALLARAAGSAGRARVVFARDGSRWLADGRVLTAADDACGPLLALFSRLALSSLTVRAGLTVAELAALCESSAARPESLADLRKFLAERRVERLAFNEAHYAKVPDGFQLAPGDASASWPSDTEHGQSSCIPTWPAGSSLMPPKGALNAPFGNILSESTMPASVTFWLIQYGALTGGRPPTIIRGSWPTPRPLRPDD